MDPKRWSTLLLVAVLTGGVSACGWRDDVQDTAETVDEAVTLLQDIEDSGTWTYLSDGLEELDNQGEGYALVARMSDGTENPARTVTIHARVDADHDAVLEITENDQTRTYFVEGYGGAAEDHSVLYRVEDGRYLCAQDDETGQLFGGGPASLFDAYAIAATGVQTLSVVEEDEDYDDQVAGRDAIRYELESRVPEAMDILSRLDHDELRARVSKAGPFQISGALYLDEDTLALLRFDSLYENTSGQSEFSFEIVQWGDIPDIAKPAESVIDVPCG